MASVKGNIETWTKNTSDRSIQPWDILDFLTRTFGVPDVDGNTPPTFGGGGTGGATADNQEIEIESLNNILSTNQNGNGKLDDVNSNLNQLLTGVSESNEYLSQIITGVDTTNGKLEDVKDRLDASNLTLIDIQSTETATYNAVISNGNKLDDISTASINASDNSDIFKNSKLFGNLNTSCITNATLDGLATNLFLLYQGDPTKIIVSQSTFKDGLNYTSVVTFATLV